jgi:pimeloyl-ACP methyl ester carboxylesterase
VNAAAQPQRLQRLLSAGRIVRGQRVEGPGPTWLLLPPLGTGIATWLPVLNELHGKCNAITVDFAGFGTSEIGKADPSYIEQRALLASYLDTLNGPLVLAGCSTSATLCVELARREEHRVEAVVLSGFGQLNDVSAWLERLHLASTAPQSFLDAMFYDAALRQPEQQAAVDACLVRPAYRSFFDKAAHAALQSGVEGLQVPTLFIAGREDRLIAHAEVEAAARQIEQSHVQWVERCGHLVPAERPAEFVHAVQKFLKSLAPECASQQPFAASMR